MFLHFWRINIRIIQEYYGNKEYWLKIKESMAKIKTYGIRNKTPPGKGGKQE